MVARSNKEQNFERAFSDGAGSDYGVCACGKAFYCGDYPDKDGEEFKKRNNPTILPWSISWMSFEGKTYVMDCACWVERATQVMKFLDSHSRKIAAYFKLEKERKMIEAQSSPVIE